MQGQKKESEIVTQKPASTIKNSVRANQFQDLVIVNVIKLQMLFLHLLQICVLLLIELEIFYPPTIPHVFYLTFEGSRSKLNPGMMISCANTIHLPQDTKLLQRKKALKQQYMLLTFGTCSKILVLESSFLLCTYCTT